MEILQFLLSFFIEQFDDGKYKQIYELFKSNDFDVIKTLKNIKPETLSPILSDFINKNKNPAHSEKEFAGLSPVINFADKQIVQSLSDYFNQL